MSNSINTSLMKKIGLGAQVLIVLGLLAFLYYPAFVWMIERWSARDSYYGHGFLIPAVSLYWLYKKKEVFRDSRSSINAMGVVFLVSGGLMQIASSALRIYFVSAFSFVFVVLGISAILFGVHVFRRIWFPLCFLFLMIPLPLLVISEATLKMKFFVSEISAHILNFIGIKAVREGSYIYTPHSVLLVGDPCSGLRSFLAFLCLGFVFAYQSKVTTWKRAVLVAAGLPLAILSNVLRVFFLSLMSEIYGMDAIHGFVHDASGVVVFIIAFALFVVLQRKLESIHA